VIEALTIAEIGGGSGPPLTNTHSNTHLDSSRVPYSTNDGGWMIRTSYSSCITSKAVSSSICAQWLAADITFSNWAGVGTSGHRGCIIIPLHHLDMYHNSPIPQLSPNNQFPVTSSKSVSPSSMINLLLFLGRSSSSLE